MIITTRRNANQLYRDGWHPLLPDEEPTFSKKSSPAKTSKKPNTSEGKYLSFVEFSKKLEDLDNQFKEALAKKTLAQAAAKQTPLPHKKVSGTFIPDKPLPESATDSAARSVSNISSATPTLSAEQTTSSDPSDKTLSLRRYAGKLQKGIVKRLSVLEEKAAALFLEKDTIFEQTLQKKASQQLNGFLDGMRPPKSEGPSNTFASSEEGRQLLSNELGNMLNEYLKDTKAGFQLEFVWKPLYPYYVNFKNRKQAKIEIKKTSPTYDKQRLTEILSALTQSGMDENEKNRTSFLIRTTELRLSLSHDSTPGAGGTKATWEHGGVKTHHHVQWAAIVSEGARKNLEKKLLIEAPPSAKKEDFSYRLDFSNDTAYLRIKYRSPSKRFSSFNPQAAIARFKRLAMGYKMQ